MPKEYIWVDGACRGNGRGQLCMAGVGVYYGDLDKRNLYAPLFYLDTTRFWAPTNQRAELCAVRQATTNIAREIEHQRCKRPACIYTDSLYVYRIVNRWANKWELNGWVKANGDPVANQDLIKDIMAKVESINKYYEYRGWTPLVIKRVRGHSGNLGNARADQLANLGADAMEKVLVHKRDEFCKIHHCLFQLVPCDSEDYT